MHLSRPYPDLRHVPKEQLLTTRADSYVSPRTRAQRTLELLNLGCRDRYPWHQSSCAHPQSETCPSCSTLDIRTNASIEVTDAVREWDYGDYEGKVSADIRRERAARGLNADWDIWRDGCEGGESPGDIEKRLDALIKEIREKFHKGMWHAACLLLNTGVRKENRANMKFV